jgi:predicted RNA-binding protein
MKEEMLMEELVILEVLEDIVKITHLLTQKEGLKHRMIP